MPLKNRNAVRSGIFMLVSAALVIAIVISIAGLTRLTEHWQERSVQFSLADDVGGLNVGDDVRIGGFKVGVVKSIEIFGYEHPDDKQPAHILVIFSMPRKYVLREGTMMRIQGTLTGQSWLNIDQLGYGEPLPPQVALNGKPSTTTLLTEGLGDVVPQVKAAISEIRTTTIPKINTAVDDAHGLLADSRPKVSSTLDRASEALVAVRDMLGPSSTDFHGAVADVHQITSNLKDKMPGLIDSATGLLKKVDGATTRATDALVDIQQTAANAKDATGSLRSILVGNRGKFDSMIASLKTTSDNLKNASAEIRRSPWRLLYKPGPDEMANLNLFDSAREFAEGANSLSDASTALRDALADKTAKPEDIKKLTDQLNESFQHFQDVEKKLWKEVQQ